MAELDLHGLVQAGDGIIWSGGAAEPLSLSRSLIAQRRHLAPVSVFVGTMFSDTLLARELEGVEITGIGGIGTARELTKAGIMRVIPCHFGQIPSFIEQGLIKCDVAFVQVSPPGPNGLHSFGISLDYMSVAVRKARTVVAEINEQIPWVYGAQYIAPSQIHCAVTLSRAPLQIPPTQPDDLSMKIGMNAAAHVDDGSVLQVGIGRLADVVLLNLRSHRNLGVHSGMIGDAILELLEAGTINNSQKTIDAGITVTGALFGTDRLYRYAHNNSSLFMQPVTYTHDPGVLARLQRFVSINSALEVDLTGQVNAEAAGNRYLGTVGGQPDFVRAGQRSPNGRAIIALPSTSADGSASTICVRLSGPVTTSRSDADVIVTEHGSAFLRGQPFAERIRRMIAIAHPRFREGLESEASNILRRGY